MPLLAERSNTAPRARNLLSLSHNSVGLSGLRRRRHIGCFGGGAPFLPRLTVVLGGGGAVSYEQGIAVWGLVGYADDATLDVSEVPLTSRFTA